MLRVFYVGGLACWSGGLVVGFCSVGGILVYVCSPAEIFIAELSVYALLRVLLV